MSTATAVKIPASEQEALTVGELRAWRGLLRAYGCLAKRLDAELERWAHFSAPNSVYAYCFCTVQ